VATATVGDRIRRWRLRRGMSQRVLADLAGLSQPYVSQVESGRRSVERRATLTAIAAALQVSVAELLGHAEPGEPARDQARAYVPAIREALIMREAGERSSDPVPEEVVRRAMLAEVRCDYPAAMAPLPGLLRAATGPQLVDLLRFTMFLLNSHGQPDLARDAARLSLAEARKLDDPAWLGVAAFAWPTRCRRRSPASRRRPPPGPLPLQPHAADPQVRQVYGMLHLTAGLRNAIASRPQAAGDWVEEAKSEAASLGEPEGLGFAMLMFGPTNVGVWEVNIAAELGDPVEVLRIADRVTPDRLPGAQRRANYHANRGRALVGVGGRDDEAVTAFLRAEEHAPQWLRNQPIVRDAVHVILTRTRRGSASAPLRRLAGAVRLHV
jgi:transcriptional regulator with XRE-family HTH domain